MSELVSILRNLFGHGTLKDKEIKKGIHEIISKQSQLSKREDINKIYKNEFIIYSIAITILLLTLIYLMFINK